MNTQNLRRTFDGVVEYDGHEHHVRGVGNGPLSSLANALHSLGIDVDISQYNEHSIGGSKTDERGREGMGRDVKAATYIEASSPGKKEKMWGVSIHEDIVQAGLNALLTAATSVSVDRGSVHVLCQKLIMCSL